MPKNILTVCSMLFLALTLSLSLAGCASEVSAQTISSNAISNSAELTTAKFEMSMSMAMEVTGGSDPGKATMSANAFGSIDIINMEMQMTLNGSMNFPGSDGDISFEEAMYLTGGWLYMEVSVPGEGDYWIKEKLPDYAWTSENPLAQQVEFLQTAFQVTKLGTEKVDGVDCYIIQVTPDMGALSKWVMSQQRSTDLDMGNIDLSKVFKSFSIKEWIARDEYLPVKAEINVSLEMRPEDMGETAESADMDKLTMNMSEQIKYYDYGKPVTIQLPPEAQNGEELPFSY